MVLHKATAAAGHVVRPVLEPLAKKSIWKVAPPPKVKKPLARRKKQGCFEVGNEAAVLCQESDDFQNDTSSITHQQRYVWNKLLNLPIGHEGSPPPEVREKYENAPTPKIRAVIVNHFVPKNVRYRDVIKFHQGRLHKFLERFVEHKESNRVQGYTLTELRSILGHGDLKNGKVAVEQGLACGDIQRKGQRYYMGRHFISNEQHWREGYGFDSVAKDVGHEEWEGMASELMPHDWGESALLQKVDSEIKPPSPEALGHLETAIEKCERLCHDVRKLSTQLSKYINAKINNGEQIEALGTLEEKLKVALNKASVLERTQLHKLQEMMIFNARSSTDENIKKILKSVVLPFYELEEVHTHLAAIFHKQCKTTKG